jgi:hypothetical protein
MKEGKKEGLYEGRKEGDRTSSLVVRRVSTSSVSCRMEHP